MTLQPITADSLHGFRHGFFTRKGGVSSGIYEGLNCGIGSDDDAEAVRANRKMVADAMGVAPDALVTMHQDHTDIILTVNGPLESGSAKADGLVTSTPGIAIAVVAADCQPVLLADPSAGVVGAAHAGWKGTLGGVLEAVVNAMEGLGAARENIVAAIGPSISQAAYEVGPEFFEAMHDADPEYARYFANGEGDRYQFDLPGLGLRLLRGAGVGQAEWTRHCTYSDEALFYSYRRATHRKDPDYGRLISAIRL